MPWSWEEEVRAEAEELRAAHLEIARIDREIENWRRLQESAHAARRKAEEKLSERLGPNRRRLVFVLKDGAVLTVRWTDRVDGKPNEFQFDDPVGGPCEAT